MHLKTLISLAILASTTVQAESQLDIDYMPKQGYASTTGSKYVTSSIRKKIKPSQKIKDLDKRNFAGELIVQKLTNNSYWLQYGFYSTVFYVGDKGVLLMDPLAFGKGKKVLEGIRTVTDKPVTALIYSHNSSDHIEDAKVFVEDSKAKGVDIQIIATIQTAKLIRKNRKVPTPTILLSQENGTFEFEDITVTAHGLENTIKDQDNTVWLLNEEKVAHIPDLVNPDQVPFLGLAGAPSYDSYKMNLAELHSLDWTFLSGGHGDIGGKGDVQFTQKYISDMEQAVRTAYKEYRDQGLGNRQFNNHHAKWHASSVYANRRAVEILREKYGSIYGFEAAINSHMDMFVDPDHR